MDTEYSMVRNIYHYIPFTFVLSIGVLLSHNAGAQDCTLPVVLNSRNVNTTSLTLVWEDFNTDPPLAWDLEFGLKGFQKDFIPEISGITEKQQILNSLIPGHTYEFYLRTICQDSVISLWNGPYFFSTHVDNASSCNTILEIPDNTCPSYSQFKIAVNETNDLVIGEDVILEEVDLMIEHEWPADLSIVLESPSGKRCTLIHNKGSGIDNLGDVEGLFCENSLKLSDFACQGLDDKAIPIRGLRLPDTNLNNCFKGEKTNGIWNLRICDRALGDIGIIHNVHLEFSTEICPIPSELRIIDRDADNVTIKWSNSPVNCEQLVITYRRTIDPPSESFSDFVDCTDSIYVLQNLEPNTQYVVTMFTRCGVDFESEDACEILFTTLCDNSSLSENFDEVPVCIQNCTTECSTGDFWRNDTSDSGNWFVNSGSSFTDFTGPEHDVSYSGNYVYTEADLKCSNIDQFIFLNSPCLEVEEISECQLSFDYHAFGNSMAVISLQRNIEASGWQEIWRSNASSNSEWQNHKIKILDNPALVQLRFVARYPRNVKDADIALDNIKFVSTHTTDLVPYYQDKDNDGFGDPNTVVYECGSDAPAGYVDNDGDCNDDNKDINPSISEISCNRVDDNCNGQMDELNGINFNYTVQNVTNESCPGSQDGSIELTVNSDSPVTQVTWSNGANSLNIDDLSSGIYSCTISTSMGCQLVTEGISVESEATLDYNLIIESNPTCSGISDGVVRVEAMFGTAPYNISWSDGSSGPLNSNVDGTMYSITITDDSNCTLIDSFIVDPLNNIELIDLGIEPVSCNGDSDGSIQVEASGGIEPYLYSWNNGRSGNLITGLTTGFYSVTVTDQNDCFTVLDSIEITEPTPLQIDLIQLDDINCNGGSSGKIKVQVSGGNSPYEYRWSNGLRTAEIKNLKAGSYNITINDANGCIIERKGLNLVQSSPINIQLDSINHLRCIGSENGYLQVLTTGGHPPYNYNWNISDGNTGQNESIANLTQGRYSLTVQDIYSCKSRVMSYELLNQNESLNSSLIQIDFINCFGDSSATIVAVLNEAALPVNYNWSSGISRTNNRLSDTLSFLSAGIYNLTITDDEGCVGISDSLSILQNAPIQYEIETIDDNLCHGDSSGLIDINPYGGQAPYDVHWSNNASGTMIFNLESDNYTATISDLNNCQIMTAPIIIREPEELDFDFNLEDSDLTGNGRIEVFPKGGTPPYSYSWSSTNPIEANDNVASSLIPGSYSLTITDDNLCMKDTVFIVDFISSTNDSESAYFTVYPNPNSGILNIDFNENINPDRISIYSSTHYITDIEVNKASNIDLSSFNMPNGIYYIKASINDRLIVKKFLLLQ